jgi:hypothetical protein
VFGVGIDAIEMEFHHQLETHSFHHKGNYLDACSISIFPRTASEVLRAVVMKNTASLVASEVLTAVVMKNTASLVASEVLRAVVMKKTASLVASEVLTAVVMKKTASLVASEVLRAVVMKNTASLVASEVLTAVVMKNYTFWDVTPCNIKQTVSRALLLACFVLLLFSKLEVGGDMLLRNVPFTERRYVPIDVRIIYISY